MELHKGVPEYCAHNTARIVRTVRFQKGRHTCELEDDYDEGDCHAGNCAEHRRTTYDGINPRGDALVVPGALCEETNIPYAVLQETEGKPEDSPDARADAHGGNHVTPCSVRDLGFRV